MPLTRPNPHETLERRLLEAARIIGCDPARTVRWCAARTALNLSWLLEDGDHAAAAATVPELRLWRELSGS
jgi:streptomycin 6-kinase